MVIKFYNLMLNSIKMLALKPKKNEKKFPFYDHVVTFIWEFVNS